MWSAASRRGDESQSQWRTKKSETVVHFFGHVPSISKPWLALSALSGAHHAAGTSPVSVPASPRILHLHLHLL
jgi:hypothetical protein